MVCDLFNDFLYEDFFGWFCFLPLHTVEPLWLGVFSSPDTRQWRCIFFSFFRMTLQRAWLEGWWLVSQDFPGAVIIEPCGLAVSCTRGSELVTCTPSRVLAPRSCSQHSSLFDSKSKPPVPWESSMCGEGSLFICHQKGWCDHCRQPVKWRRDGSWQAWQLLIGRPF